MPFEKDPAELGALWEKSSARGTYFSGTINGQAVVVFRNDKKTPGSKSPDYRVLKAKPRDDAAQGRQADPDDPGF